MNRNVRKISELADLAKMRKSIDLDDDVFVAYQKEAIDRRVSAKKLMESILLSYAKEKISHYKTAKVK